MRIREVEDEWPLFVAMFAPLEAETKADKETPINQMFTYDHPLGWTPAHTPPSFLNMADS
ncbi:hypothetical protein AZE42_10328 [Rhizopogon vesiculosus]|uniref:Uncharacterized protein n=1 Tax=Rhizopogon vesiculosus TaxID=180088 RepID=A0A1J8PY67_9AGAM|nr:hypothetical protein AZE42_10328 [Rhizopogon vesiculosus]